MCCCAYLADGCGRSTAATGFGALVGAGGVVVGGVVSTAGADSEPTAAAGWVAVSGRSITPSVIATVAAIPHPTRGVSARARVGLRC